MKPSNTKPTEILEHYALQTTKHWSVGFALDTISLSQDIKLLHVLLLSLKM